MNMTSQVSIKGEAKVRPACEEDIPTLWEIERGCFADPYPLPLLHSLLTLHAETFLVAENDGGMPIGYTVAAVRWQLVGHILSIAVVPSHQRRGIGKRLLQELLGKLWGIGVKEIRLEVRESSRAARHLYEKSGFKAIYVVERYYPDGENAIVMHLSAPA